MMQGAADRSTSAASSNFEDKKCRICGYADVKNKNIFGEKQCNLLIEKIVTVYPIVLYANDPLPKCICNKCIYNVTIMYNDIQRVQRMQQKWLNNVRTVQPNHSYVQITDFIKKSRANVRKCIITKFGEDIMDFRMEHIELDEATSAADVETQMQLATSEHTNSATVTQNKTAKSGDIKAIKNTLQLNGCTLLSVSKNTKAKDNIELKLESSSAQNTVQCVHCPATFENLKALALHQQTHLRINLLDVCQKKCLPKNLRRGRLLNSADSKNIRCLNCWRLYVDNKTILNHWAEGECEFYCRICGKEFANAPKLLREHVLSQHGISYRSVRMLPLHAQPRLVMPAIDSKLKAELTKPLMLSANKSTSSPGKNNSTTTANVRCHICKKTFQNYKALNPHMRKHKLTYDYEDFVLPPTQCFVTEKANETSKHVKSPPKTSKTTSAFSLDSTVDLPSSRPSNSHTHKTNPSPSKTTAAFSLDSTVDLPSNRPRNSHAHKTNTSPSKTTAAFSLDSTTNQANRSSNQNSHSQNPTTVKTIKNFSVDTTVTSPAGSSYWCSDSQNSTITSPTTTATFTFDTAPVNQPIHLNNSWHNQTQNAPTTIDTFSLDATPMEQLILPNNWQPHNQNASMPPPMTVSTFSLDTTAVDQNTLPSWHTATHNANTTPPTTNSPFNMNQPTMPSWHNPPPNPPINNIQFNQPTHANNWPNHAFNAPTTHTVIKGIRTKFVVPRGDAVKSPVIQVKPLKDLQQPSVISHTNTPMHYIQPTVNSWLVPPETVEFDDQPFM